MNQRRDPFAKRRRETELKEKALAKQARRLAKRNEVRTVKGPPIAGEDELPDDASTDADTPDQAAPGASDDPSGTDPSGTDPSNPTE